MTARGGSRIVLAIALVLAIAGNALATDAPDSPLAELKALIKSGKYAEAETGARALLGEVETARGAESVEAATVIDVLVESLWRGGKAKESATRAMAERALAIREKGLGLEHPDVADSLNSFADLLGEVGDYSGARKLRERALAIQEKSLGPDHPDVARTLKDLAVVLVDTGDYAAARPLYERAVAILEKALGPEDPNVARTLNSLANLLKTTGDFATARPLYERALAIEEKALGPDHRDVASVLNGLANLHSDMGDYAAARPLYERAVAIWEKVLGPEHPNVGVTLLNLANLLDDIGDYAGARRCYERVLTIFEKAYGPDHLRVAVTLLNLAIAVHHLGDYAAALPLYERAVATSEEALGPEHPTVAAALNSLALLYRDTGDYAAARPLYERAVAIYKKALGPEHPNVAATLDNLGNLLGESGDYAAARPLLERALAIREKALGPETPGVARSLTSLAGLLYLTGDYVAARPLLDHALAIQEKNLGPEHPDVAATLNAIANLLDATGADPAARSLLDRALAIRKRSLGPEHPRVANLLNHAARQKAFEGDTSAALDAALGAEQIAREHLRLTGRSLSERQALGYAAVRASGLDLAMTLAARGLDSDSRRRTLDAVVRSRALVLDEMSARHRAVSGATDPEVARLVATLSSARARLANLTVRGPGDQQPEIYRKLLDDARNEKEQAERALAGMSASFAEELSRQRLGLDEVAASLSPGSALVAFAQYKKIDLTPRSPAGTTDKPAPKAKDVPSYLVFVLRAGEKDPQVVDLGTAEAMDGFVAAWKKEASGNGLESSYREAGTALRKRLWDPLTAALGDAERVFVVPDGSLNLVSLAALPLDDGSYLIEHGPLVHYVSAERDLVPSGETRHGEGLLAIGAPSYDATSLFASLRKPDNAAPAPKPKAETPMLIASAATYRGQRSACGDFASARFAPLPGTGKETREIVRLWQKHGPSGSSIPSAAVDLRDAAASESALKRSAAGHRVLHLATHGFFLGGECKSALDATRAVGGLTGTAGVSADAPPPPVTGENPLLLSGLALAGANHRSAAGPGEDDGILTAEEIASLDLSGVEWAVLSACDTGVGEIKAGEGVFGLRRAFQVAGARTLIMSLWSVEDEVARSWMKALYSGRLEGHLDTAEAVRRASLEVLQDRRAHKKSTHPFYWAGFVAAGDWK